jgi:hypothetical protein
MKCLSTTLEMLLTESKWKFQFIRYSDVTRKSLRFPNFYSQPQKVKRNNKRLTLICLGEWTLLFPKSHLNGGA